MRKSLVLSLIMILNFSGLADASSVLLDDFNSGLDGNIWSAEQLGGSSWVWGSDAGNGYVVSEPQKEQDRYLDIFSEDQSFSDFALSFDMKFDNNGYDQDWRRIYLRMNGSFDAHEGYCINIRNWSGGEYDFVGIGPYTDDTLDIEPQSFEQYFSPLVTGEWYRFNVDMVENNIKIKYWLLSGLEPTDPQIDVVDSGSLYSSGGIGFGNYWHARTLIDNVQLEVIPEPSSLLLLSLGGLLLRRKRKVS